MTEYRTMNETDIGAALALCRATGWNQLESDWRAFLQLRPGGSCVATELDEVVGTVTTISYAEKIAWIGMVLVDARCQRQGIGKRLLEEALQLLRGVETVKLDATPAGREVYLKLGFKDEYGLSRMIGQPMPESAGLPNAASITRADLQAVAGLDAKAFGVNRQALLQWLYENNPGAAFAVWSGKEITGYCLCRKGYHFFHVGPVIAHDLETAKILLHSASRQASGQPVVLDVPNHNPEWLNWLQVNGYQEQRQFTRMYRGSNYSPGEPGLQFAIVGPEFG